MAAWVGCRWKLLSPSPSGADEEELSVVRFDEIVGRIYSCFCLSLAQRRNWSS